MSYEEKALYNIYVDTDRLIITNDHSHKAVLIRVYIHRDILNRWGVYVVADEYDLDPAFSHFLPKNYHTMSDLEQEAILSNAIEETQRRLLTDYALRTKVFGEKSKPKGDYKG
jgi:hypothetical protein